ncbi:YciI family protein [Fimbriimonas ginsengisoli]|uniref:YCII-related domain-containing protein n=1 Tax=Fimbriimonas ginsengisoli Gsoil 348 TaxID=661478 RepID=A0A068NWT9_FIMGI|nr:YciI family protein [Fimbriimonas ginsengisoli]AIE87911.1 hypothetical protein OP10G_4543 [Fimbriimonas ginsengisoli Gsoil 348]
MKYLCLIYIDEKILEALSDAEIKELFGEGRAYTEQLRESGHYLASNRLQSAQSAATIRVRDGNTLITDGPFAETKEQLAGFILIEARDLNDAIRVAAKIPSGRLGCIEVRPVA